MVHVNRVWERIVHLLRTSLIPTAELNKLVPPAAALLENSLPRLEPCFPLLVSQDGNFHWGAFAFLLDTFRIDSTRTRQKTLSTYAEGLKSWLEYVEHNGEDWTRPTAVLLSEYRRFLSSDPGRKRKLARTTVNLRTTTVREFYKFLQHWDGAGLADSHGSWDTEPIAQFLARTSRLRRAKRYKKRVRAMSPEETSLMAANLRMPYSLIFLWTLGTGARRTTVADLELDQLPKSILKINYIETTTKGGKTIDLVATARLIQRTFDYCETVRKKWAAKSLDESVRIFLNSKGRPVTSKAYYQAFKRVADKLGLKVNPHMARHTFAANMESRLEAMARKGANINPIKIVQHLLAHNSAQTTELYLASVSSIDAGTLRAMLETEEALG